MRDGRVVTGGTPISTRDAILDAAFTALERHGMAKLSLGDVAKQAGLSRQTVYRYFRTRDDLIVSAMVRELTKFITLVDAEVDRHEGVQAATEAIIRSTLTLARDHVLLNRLLDSEADALLPYLATDASPVLAAAGPSVERMVATRAGHLPIADVRRFADTLIRMLVSHILHRSPEPVEVIAAELSTLLINGLLPAQAPPTRHDRHRRVAQVEG